MAFKYLYLKVKIYTYIRGYPQRHHWKKLIMSHFTRNSKHCFLKNKDNNQFLAHNLAKLNMNRTSKFQFGVPYRDIQNHCVMAFSSRLEGEWFWFGLVSVYFVSMLKSIFFENIPLFSISRMIFFFLKLIYSYVYF